MSKRRNGEASIFAYRNGYAAYAWVTTPDGARKRKWVYGKTHDEVHAKWIKLQNQASEGPIPTSVPRRRPRHAPGRVHLRGGGRGRLPQSCRRDPATRGAYPQAPLVDRR